MPAPYNNIASKLDRAICAYLVSMNCGGIADIRPHMAAYPKRYPNTVVATQNGSPDVLFSGSMRCTVNITIRGSASEDDSEPNVELARLLFDQRVALTRDAMLMTGADGMTFDATLPFINAAANALATPLDATPDGILFAQNNADMADFTAQKLLDAGFDRQAPDVEGCAWQETHKFVVVCCGSAIPG